MSVDNITAKTNAVDLTDPSELDLDLDYDSFDEGGSDRPAERWAPLGAAVSPTPSPYEPRLVSCLTCSNVESQVIVLSTNVNIYL